MVAAAISFVLVGLFWLAHHRIFVQIRRRDPVLLRLNLLSLAPIVFLPFATQLIGEYGGFRSSVVIYSITVAAAGLLFTLLWVYAAAGHRLISSTVTHRMVVIYAARTGSVAVVFGASILVALASPRAAQYMWLALIAPLLLLRVPAVERGRRSG